LAARLAAAGVTVTIGSRAKERAQATCDGIHQRWPDRGLPLEAGDNATAAAADVVVVATPWDAAAATVASVAHLLGGKVLISMANALARVGYEFEPLVPPRGSVASHVQAAAPGALVAAALHHLPAKELGNLDHRVESDVLVCSDHAEATRVASDLVRLIPGCRPLDTGTLSNATPIEAFAAVLLQLNVRYRTRTAIRMTGIEMSE
jgi:NADPH-dependent F420 reductase